MQGVAVYRKVHLDCLPERWREIASVNSESGMLQAVTSLATLGQHPEAQVTNPGPDYKSRAMPQGLLCCLEPVKTTFRLLSLPTQDVRFTGTVGGRYK